MAVLKETPLLPEPEWGRKRKGAPLHAWKDQSGSYSQRNEEGELVWATYHRITLCGLVYVEGHERPSRRGRRCKSCVKRTADPRPGIGRALALGWPRAKSLAALRLIANTKDEDRIMAALTAMETDHLVFRSAVGGRYVWTARRALVERHGVTYGAGVWK